MSIYNFSAKAMNGSDIALDHYRNHVMLIVNTASQCGFTTQYEDLQKLYEKYKDQNLIILGFPCNQFGNQEPDSNDKIQTFCTLTYGVTFPMFQKSEVRGENMHPLFNYLTSELPYQGLDENNAMGKLLVKMLQEKFPEYLVDDSIKWNFTKFLIDANGQPVKRYEPTADFLSLEEDIRSLLK